MSDLPPLDQPQAYVVVGPNDQRGPYTLDLLIDEVAAGRLSEATPIWWPGLGDWTTMAATPAIVAEVGRRRQPVAPAEPAQPSPADNTGTFAPDPRVGSPEPGPVVDPSETVASDAPSQVEDVVADATVVEIDDGHISAFNALVARSTAKASVQARVDNVHHQLVESITAGVSSAGFELDERSDERDHTELRFVGVDSDFAVVSLGRALARRIEDLHSDHLPLSITYRGAVSGVEVVESTGEHGDVVIAADEWTGQSTSAVELFLGLDHYLDERYEVRQSLLADDLAATVAVLRARLS